MAGCGGTELSGTTAKPARAHTYAAKPSVAAKASPAAKSGTARVTISVPAANRQGAFQSPQTLTLPRGWKAEAWALVGGARLETWTPEGNLLVSVPSSGNIVELIPQATRSAPPAQRTIISGLENPQGMAFDHVGGQEVLYVAGSGEIDRFVWVHGQPTSRSVFAAGLPDGGAHPLKNVAVGRNHTVYFDIGSLLQRQPGVAQQHPSRRGPGLPARRPAHPGLRHRDPQRRRPLLRPRRNAVDRGQHAR